MTPAVTSTANRRVKLAASLHRPSGCLEHGAFLVEGPRFLDCAGRIRPMFVLISTDATDEAVSAAGKARAAGFEVIELAPRVFARVSSTSTPQGIAAVFPLPSWSGDDVFKGSTVVALDGVSDPGNAGTIIRSALAFGCSGAVFLPGSAFPYSPKTTRAAAGTNMTLPVITEDSLEDLVQRFPGYLFAGADSGGTPLERFAPGRPVCMVVGSEAHGLSPRVRSCLSGLVAIPMAGGVDSLNAGVCASIILHHLSGNCIPAVE